MNDFVLNDYFDWLYFKVTSGNVARKKSFRKLIGLLHNMEFRYMIDHDENRASDGINLRWYYVNDGGDDEILRWKEPCTVLEMLLSIAIHMESIMDDPDIECSAAHWFWILLQNLDLNRMSDDKFDKAYAYGRVSMFMDRTYEPNGDGNIFYIPNIDVDLRDVEIWYQMCWFIDNLI